MDENKNKSKILNVILDNDLYYTLNEITENKFDFVREAIKEKIELKKYFNNNHTESLKIREIKLIIHDKKSQIELYHQIIEREENEIKELELKKQQIEKQILNKEGKKIIS